MEKQTHLEGFDETLDYEFVSANKEKAQLKLHIKKKHLNIYGYVHGGVYYSISDAASGYIVRKIEGNWVTLNSSFNYLKAVKEGMIEVHASLISLTSKLAVIEVITRQNDLKLSIGTFTMYRITA